MLLEFILGNRQALLPMECVKISKRNDNNNSLYFSVESFLIFNSLVNASKNAALTKDLEIVANVVKLDFATLAIKIVKI